jgi:hypothetical protein
MAELEHAHDNVRAALAWSMSADGVLAVGVDLAGTLGWFWLVSGRLKEAGSWYAALLARRTEADNTLAWAKALQGSALQCWGRGELAQAAAYEEPAVGIFRSAGDRRWLTYGLTLLARLRTSQERPAEARALLEEARLVWSRAETTFGQPSDAARAHLQASLVELDAAGDDTDRAVVLGSLGLLAQRGEHTQAQARFADSLPVLRGGHDQWDPALLLLNDSLEKAEAASPAAGPLLIEALRAWQRLPAGRRPCARRPGGVRSRPDRGTGLRYRPRGHRRSSQPGRAGRQPRVAVNCRRGSGGHRQVRFCREVIRRRRVR